jgi:murein DD-endopeptidase MepM/ murein hydrolase activator NlpD
MTARRRALALVLVALTVLPAFPAGADDLDDELDEVADRIGALADEIDAAEAQRGSLASEILDTQGRINALRADLDVARDALADATRNLNVERIRLDRLRDDLRNAYLALADTRERLVVGREQAKLVARNRYMNAGQHVPVVVFDAATLSEAAITIAYLDRIAGANDAAINSLQALEDQEATQRRSIAGRRDDVAASVEVLALVEVRRAEHAQDVAASTAAVESELASQQSLLAQLDSEVAEFEDELDVLEAEQDRIVALIAAEQQDDGEEVDEGEEPSQSSSGFVRPVPGPISSGFGPRYHPILGYMRLHTGVDMSAAQGDPIRAALAGRVILGSYYGGYGNAVIIDHGGGMTTLYAHQSALEVGYGDQVEAGEVIGYVGSTGLSTGPHLHFEVRMDGVPVDPAPYLAGT